MMNVKKLLKGCPSCRTNTLMHYSWCKIHLESYKENKKEEKEVWIVYDIGRDWDGDPELIPFGIVESEDEAKKLEHLIYTAHFFPITLQYNEESQEKRKKERELAQRILKEKYNLECESWSVKIASVKMLNNKKEV